MPTGIYLPPWLQPVDQVGPFMQGVSQGVSMARTALAAQAQQFEAQQAQQQLALRQQQEERAIGEAVSRVVAEREQQKRQQQLVDMKAQAAASQFMAQKEYEESIAGGEPPERALMRLAPRLGINPSALAGRMMQPQATIRELDVSGKRIPVIQQPSGTITVLPKSEEEREKTWQEHMQKGADYSAWRTEFNSAIREAAQAQKALSEFNSKGSNRQLIAAGDPTAIEQRDSLQKRVVDTDSEVQRIRDQGVTRIGTGQKSPYPEKTIVRNKKDGKLYQIRNGEPILIGE